MKTSAVVVYAVCGLIVVGLVATAVPAVASLGQVVHGAVDGVGHLAGLTGATPNPLPSATEPAAGVARRNDLSEGYVSIGDGMRTPAGGPGDCTGTAVLMQGGNRADAPAYAQLLGSRPIDMGARPGASGGAITDAHGLRAYVVAPNDGLIAIGERFCVDYLSLSGFNHVRSSIHPGRELILRPDPTIPWVDPYEPYEAAPGTFTGSYYDAIDAMSKAVAARDLAAARSVWPRLASDVSPVATAAAAQALDEGDWTVLGQMFP